jgi:dynein heavy chain
MKKQLNTPNIDDLLKSPIVFTAFATPSSSSYLPVDSMDVLRKVVDAKLTEYNESNAMMDLVLFEQAAQHIARISRIISNPAVCIYIYIYVYMYKYIY